MLEALYEEPRALVLALPESFRDQLARTVLETGWRAKEVGRAEGRLEGRVSLRERSRLLQYADATLAEGFHRCKTQAVRLFCTVAGERGP